MTTISAMADASVTLLHDDSKFEFNPLNKGLNNKNGLMSQEKRSQPSVLEQHKADDYISNIQKCCTTFAVEYALRKIPNVVGSLYWTVIQE
ncbi:2075_t:CDS:2 [Gigaspora margarita]|uniref:2075_t:CDS:1 n=1 Tax=Gigaspora margarita TaxID=4874 RepID=A0ABN7VCL7_GIGMA|nr:2075_t:CDS:2 [Gigaspora margarita]